MLSAHDHIIATRALFDALSRREKQNYEANVAKLEQLIADANAKSDEAQGDAGRWQEEVRTYIKLGMNESDAAFLTAQAHSRRFINTSTYWAGVAHGLKRALSVVKGLG